MSPLRGQVPEHEVMGQDECSPPGALVPRGEGGGWRVGVEAGRVWAGVSGGERRAGGARGGVPCWGRSHCLFEEELMPG